MRKIDIDEAGPQLNELADEVIRGEQVLITRADGAVFNLISAVGYRPRPCFGSARGEVRVSDDFDEPLEDFEDYMP